jgi:hypothetical protein
MMKGDSQPVLDLCPWPTGFGFQGAADWWFYVTSRNEEEKLDLLLAAALLNNDVREKLLNHDLSLFDRFQFSPETLILLSQMRAETLTKLCKGLISQASPPR